MSNERRMEQSLRGQLDRPLCRQTYLWKEEEDGVIIIRSRKKHILNRTGAFIWKLIDEKNTAGDILSKCKEHYKDKELDSRLLEEKVLGFLEELYSVELIDFVPSLWKEEPVK